MEEVAAFCGGSYSATYRFGICTAAFPAVGCKRSSLVELDTIRCILRVGGSFFAFAFALLRCVLPYAFPWSRGLIHCYRDVGYTWNITKSVSEINDIPHL